MKRRRIAVGSDMVHDVAARVADHLAARGVEVVRCSGAAGTETPWPDAAEQVARLVAGGAVHSGVVCCWTGTGVSIAANKVPGVRAALCRDPETASGARRWNDANVLALSLAATDAQAARDIVDAWLAVDSADADEAANVSRVAALEERYRAGAETSGH